MQTEKFDADLCDDCLTMAANGWDERLIGRPVPEPCPLSRLIDDEGTNVLVGTAEDDPHFGKSPCEGCGNPAHGNRSTVTVVLLRKE